MATTVKLPLNKIEALAAKQAAQLIQEAVDKANSLIAQAEADVNLLTLAFCNQHVAHECRQYVTNPRLVLEDGAWIFTYTLDLPPDEIKMDEARNQARKERAMNEDPDPELHGDV